MWLQPSSRAIRLIPHPRLFNRSIAATSSGVCITSLRGNSPHGAGCIPSSILRPPLHRGVHFSPSTRVQFILSADTAVISRRIRWLVTPNRLLKNPCADATEWDWSEGGRSLERRMRGEARRNERLFSYLL